MAWFFRLHDRMLSSAPGSGKTTMALYVADALLRDGTMDVGVFVVPVVVMRQWQTTVAGLQAAGALDGVDVGFYVSSSKAAQWPPQVLRRPGNGKRMLMFFAYELALKLYDAGTLLQRTVSRPSTLLVMDELTSNNVFATGPLGAKVRALMQGAPRKLVLSAQLFLNHGVVAETERYLDVLGVAHAAVPPKDDPSMKESGPHPLGAFWGDTLAPLLASVLASPLPEAALPAGVTWEDAAGPVVPVVVPADAAMVGHGREGFLQLESRAEKASWEATPARVDALLQLADFEHQKSLRPVLVLTRRPTALGQALEGALTRRGRSLNEVAVLSGTDGPHEDAAAALAAVNAYSATPEDCPAHFVVLSYDRAVGVNLDVCDAVVLADQPWTTAAMMQGVGRAARAPRAFARVRPFYNTSDGVGAMVNAIFQRHSFQQAAAAAMVTCVERTRATPQASSAARTSRRPEGTPKHASAVL